MFDIDLNFLKVVLAMQELQREIPGEAAPAQNGELTQGRPAGDTGAFGNIFFIFMLVLLAMFVFMILGNRRERKKRETMIASIKKHDKVQTIGGVIGSIVELKPDFVVLKVDESSNTRITFARSAIQQVLKSSTTGSKEKEKVIEQPPE